MRRRPRTRRQWIAAVATITVAMVGVPLACRATFGPAGTPEPAVRTPRTTGPVELQRLEGWIPYWGDPETTARTAARAGISDLLFFAATVRPDGTLRMEAERRMARAVAAAHAEGAASWLTVANHGKSLAQVLTPEHREALVGRLLAAHRLSGCRHLDLDLEQLTRSQTAELVPLAAALGARLPAGAQLGITLQPVDVRLRPWAIPHVRALLAAPHVFTVRFMCYDYHWRTSLPGALCPKPAYERLLHTYPDHAGKLSMALPLYGYAWPRPDDASLPAANVVTLPDVDGLAQSPHTQLLWMEEEAELAAITRPPGSGTPVWAAVPSLRAVAERAALARYHGVPAVAFWHLGCGGVEAAVAAAGATPDSVDDPSDRHLKSWDEVLGPWKRRVCKTVTGKRGDSFAKLAERHGVSRSALYRFNEELTDATLPGATIYLPLQRARR